jgi:hypothetical protein
MWRLQNQVLFLKEKGTEIEAQTDIVERLCTQYRAGGMIPRPLIIEAAPKEFNGCAAFWIATVGARTRNR